MLPITEMVKGCTNEYNFRNKAGAVTEATDITSGICGTSKKRWIRGVVVTFHL